MVVLLLGMGPSASLLGAEANNDSGEASTSLESRQNAIRAIPFGELTEAMKATLQPVISRPSIYRKLPTKTIACAPDLHVFLVRHPEVLVNIWELMGATKVTIQRTGPFTFVAQDGHGFICNVQLVYGTHNKHILYVEGTYPGSMLHRKGRVRCVLVLRSDYGISRKDGRPLVRDRLDLFVRLDQVGANILAKTFQPLVGKNADANFLLSALFIGKISLAAETNHVGMQRLAKRLKKVTPEVQNQFTQQIAKAAQQKKARTATKTAARATPTRAR